jgi:hypothetical protein
MDLMIVKIYQNDMISNINKINIFEPIYEKGYQAVYIDSISFELLNSKNIIFFSKKNYTKYKYSYDLGYKYGIDHGKIYGFGRYSSLSRNDVIVFVIGYIDGYNRIIRDFS